MATLATLQHTLKETLLLRKIANPPTSQIWGNFFKNIAESELNYGFIVC